MIYRIRESKRHYFRFHAWLRQTNHPTWQAGKEGVQFVYQTISVIAEIKTLLIDMLSAPALWHICDRQWVLDNFQFSLFSPREHG